MSLLPFSRTGRREIKKPHKATLGNVFGKKRGRKAASGAGSDNQKKIRLQRNLIRSSMPEEAHRKGVSKARPGTARLGPKRKDTLIFM